MKYSSSKTCVSICMMTQILITYHLNNWIWKNIKYKLEIHFLTSSNNNKNWGWPYMAYLIWKIHKCFYYIDKKLLRIVRSFTIGGNNSRVHSLSKIIERQKIKEKAIGLLCIMNCKILGANSFLGLFRNFCDVAISWRVCPFDLCSAAKQCPFSVQSCTILSRT